MPGCSVILSRTMPLLPGRARSSGACISNSILLPPNRNPRHGGRLPRRWTRRGGVEPSPDMDRRVALETIIGTVAVLTLAAGIIALGWNEPLRYRFLSAQEIEEIEHPIPIVESTPTPGAWMNDPSRKTMLDVPAKPVGGGVSPYQTKPSLDRTSNRY